VARADTPGAFTNTAAADRTTAFPVDPDSADNQASATVTVARRPADLTISKTMTSAQNEVGRPIEFTISVTNQGPSTADDVVVDDAFPDGLTPIAVSDPACTISDRTMRCAYDSLPARQTRQITIAATVTTTGAFTNMASTAAANPDPDPDNNTATAAGTIDDAPHPGPPAPAAPLPATGNRNPTATLGLALTLITVGTLILTTRPRRKIHRDVSGNRT
jgi:uncharacterized repeat protein (TIGR01451 family)